MKTVKNFKPVQFKEDELRILGESALEANSRLSPAEEAKLFSIFQSEESDERSKNRAREIIMQKSQGYVVKLATTKYSGRGLEVEDLIQEGNIGLMQAIDRFDPERGCRFLTFADDWICRALGRASEEKGSTNLYQVRAPCYVYLAIGRVRKNLPILRKELGREPTVAELAVKCSQKPKDVEKALVIINRKIDSLDRDVDNGDSQASISETISSGVDDEVENIIMQGENKNLMEKLLSRLKPNDKKVIEMRYGLNGYEPHTQDEVCEVLGISRTKVATIQQSAHAKLVAMPEAEYLHDILIGN